jgi:ABC-2 type transport system permease protein
MIEAIFWVTVRGLLSRRRSLLLILLAVLPVLIAVLVRLTGRDANPVRIELGVFDNLLIRTVLPLIALVLGTGAIGSELDDGTAAYLLVKPIPRWIIVAAKLGAAAGVTAMLVVPSVLATGFLIAGDQGGGASIAIAYAIGAAAGSLMYCAVFLAASIATGRALIIGLIYVLLWEGLLSGLFAGSRAFSIRQYTTGIASLVSPDRVHAQVDLLTTAAGTASVLILGFVLATRWLSTYQVRAAE